MKNATHTEVQSRARFANGIIPQQLELFDTEPAGEFYGTNNPRHLRVIEYLLRAGWIMREQLDRIAGCSNGPDLMAQLDRRGLKWECVLINAKDRDGRACRPGMYRLTATGRKQLEEWQARTEAKNK